MSAPRDFVSRWSRLKRKAKSTRHPLPEGQGTPVVAQVAPRPLQHVSATAANEPFDIRSLPPIDAITSDTDIRAFLRSQVPGHLTRAALRKAWTTDPAIRDFVGIAESQWDFNDPNGMAGFSPLRPTDNALTLLEQRLSHSETVVEVTDLDQIMLGKEPDLTVATGRLADTPADGGGERAASMRDGVGAEDISLCASMASPRRDKKS